MNKAGSGTAQRRQSRLGHGVVGLGDILTGRRRWLLWDYVGAMPLKGKLSSLWRIALGGRLTVKPTRDQKIKIISLKAVSKTPPSGLENWISSLNKILCPLGAYILTLEPSEEASGLETSSSLC
jgi:hypothetical protein